MSDKLPWFKFFPFDWLSDTNVQTMTLAERGFYIEILCRIWVDGGIKNDRTHVERLFNTCSANDQECSTHVQTQTIDTVISCLNETEDGEKLTHWKLEELRENNSELIEKRRKAGKKSAEARRKNKGNTCSTHVQHMSNKSESESDINVHTHGFAEAPSLDESIEFGKVNMIPKALVEKWHSKNEFDEWPILANGKLWSQALLNYWKSIPPKAQNEWRATPGTSKPTKSINPDKANREKRKPTNVTKLS